MIQLQLETTNVCNAACVFCPYPSMKRPKGTMDMDLFKRIIDETAHIPVISHVTFTGLGEPLLDRHLVERIKYTRRQMRAIPIDIYTNGSFLTRDRIDQLHSAGLTTMYVSLNATSAERREQVMKVKDYDKVVEMIDYALLKQGWSVVVKGIVSKDLMAPGENEAFAKRWGGSWQLPEGHAFLHLEGNWAGKIYPMRIPINEPCPRAMGQIMVLWDGRVSLCCFDAEGDHILGSLNTNTLREVFASDPAADVRRAHIDGNRSTIPLCANCTGI